MLAALRCRRFRNLAPLEWRPAAGSNLILGPNGAGKTGLLEAVYAVATTRSFRAGQLADCVAHDASTLHLAAEVEDGRRVSLELSWSRAGGLERAVNRSPASLAEHLAVLPVVSWTVADAEVISGAPAARRRLMSQGLVGVRPAAMEVLARYRRALGQKRVLLAHRRSGLEAWNGVLAGAAAEVIRLRAGYVERLAGAFAEALAESGLALGEVRLRYRPSPPEGAGGQGAVQGALERLAASERERGMPLAGPHRDELEVLVDGHDVRRVASAGERKALGLLLTEARRRVLVAAGRTPLVLIDDADAELDPARLEAVWRVLEPDGQLLASSSRPGVWRDLPVAARWRLADGRIAPDPGPSGDASPGAADRTPDGPINR